MSIEDDPHALIEPVPVAVSLPVFTVAMTARIGTLNSHAVDDMREKAEALLPEGSALRAACLQFAVQYENMRRNPYGLQKAGEQLQRAMDYALGAKVPPGAAWRADIDG